MSGEIKRYADGNWYQGKPQETYASDHAEIWSGPADESMEHVSDEHAKYLAMRENPAIFDALDRLEVETGKTMSPTLVRIRDRIKKESK